MYVYLWQRIRTKYTMRKCFGSVQDMMMMPTRHRGQNALRAPTNTLARLFSTVLTEASMKPEPPRKEGSGELLVQGQSKAKIPGKVMRLIDSKPTSVEGRIRKMLELEKFTKQTGIKLQLRQTKEWHIPPLDTELDKELENLNSVEEHPHYWKTMGQHHLFCRNAADWYRNLRVLIRGDGPPQCRISVFHELLHNVKDESDIPYVHKAMHTCRQRHLEFDAKTPSKLVEALSRHGGIDQAVEIIRHSDYWRLFPKPSVYARLMKHAASQGNAEVMKRVETLMVAKQIRWVDGAVYSYVRGMLGNDEVCNAVAALNRACRKGDRVPSAAYTLLLDYATNKLDTSPLDCDSSLRKLLIHSKERKGNETFQQALNKALEARPDLFGMLTSAEGQGEVENADTEQAPEGSENTGAIENPVDAEVNEDDQAAPEESIEDQKEDPKTA